LPWANSINPYSNCSRDSGERDLERVKMLRNMRIGATGKSISVACRLNAGREYVSTTENIFPNRPHHPFAVSGSPFKQRYASFNTGSVERATVRLVSIAA
jgi:hypothetical protein